MSLTLQYFSVKFGLAEENASLWCVTHSLTLTHTRTHTSHDYTHMHSHTQEQARLRGEAVLSLASIHHHACMHIQTHAHVYTHTHTHTHTHPIWTVLNVVLELWRRNDMTSIERTSLVILHTVILRRKREKPSFISILNLISQRLASQEGRRNFIWESWQVA